MERREESVWDAQTRYWYTRDVYEPSDRATFPDGAVITVPKEQLDGSGTVAMTVRADQNLRRQLPLFVFAEVISSGGVKTTNRPVATLVMTK